MFAGSSAGLNVKAIIGVAALSPFYFIGFDVIPQAAEEINVPAKKIGSILILSVVLAVVFYALVIVAVGLVMGPQAIVDSEQATGLVTADAMAAAFNTKIMAKVIIVGGMCGIVTSWNSFLLGGSRAMYVALLVPHGHVLHILGMLARAGLGIGLHQLVAAVLFQEGLVVAPGLYSGVLWLTASQASARSGTPYM